MKLTPEQLQDKWDEVIELIKDTFEGTRKTNILRMFSFRFPSNVSVINSITSFHLSCNCSGVSFILSP